MTVNKSRGGNRNRIVNSLGLLGLGSVLGSLLTFSMLWAAAQNPPAFEPVAEQQLPVTAQARVKGETIQLEVARSPQEHATGLMFRAELPENRGMLFEIPTPRAQIIWTKGLQFPIDVVFLRGGDVQFVAANLPPCDADVCPIYGASVEVDQVIELRGGRAEELGITPGKTIVIEDLNR